MLERLELHHVGPAPALELDFTARLNILTGDNGLGKSFVLDVAWWALTRTWAGLPAAPHRRSQGAPEIVVRHAGQATASRSAYDFAAQMWPPEPPPSPSPGIAVYARVDGSFAVWDPAKAVYRRARHTGTGWEEYGLSSTTLAPVKSPTLHLSAQDVWDGLEENGNVLCNGLIRDWASWQGRQGEPFAQLRTALRELSPPGDDHRLEPGELTRISIDDVRDMPTIREPYGQDVAVVHASAAIKRILALAYLLVWSWQEHVRTSELFLGKPARQIVLLIDEVEAHLHPRWQRSILRSLLGVMRELTGVHDLEIQVFIVTHSPLILASLEPLFDPQRDSLWNLELEAGQVRLQREVWRRRGDANAWLTSDIFDLKEPRSLEAEQALLQAEALMKRADVGPEEFAKVQDALRRTFPAVDPFWLHWRYWAQLQGFLKE